MEEPLKFQSIQNTVGDLQRKLNYGFKTKLLEIYQVFVLEKNQLVAKHQKQMYLYRDELSIKDKIIRQLLQKIEALKNQKDILHRQNQTNLINLKKQQESMQRISKTSQDSINICNKNIIGGSPIRQIYSKVCEIDFKKQNSCNSINLINSPDKQKLQLFQGQQNSRNMQQELPNKIVKKGKLSFNQISRKKIKGKLNRSKASNNQRKPMKQSVKLTKQYKSTKQESSLRDLLNTIPTNKNLIINQQKNRVYCQTDRLMNYSKEDIENKPQRVGSKPKSVKNLMIDCSLDKFIALKNIPGGIGKSLVRQINRQLTPSSLHKYMKRQSLSSCELNSKKTIKQMRF